MLGVAHFAEYFFHTLGCINLEQAADPAYATLFKILIDMCHGGLPSL